MKLKEMDFEQLGIDKQKIVGEFTGFCEGVLAWEIPAELKAKINKKIDELKKL